MCEGDTYTSSSTAHRSPDDVRIHYSGASLWRTPLGPSWLSCIQWSLSIEDTIGTQLAVLYTVEPLYSGHHWDPAGCLV